MFNAPYKNELIIIIIVTDFVKVYSDIRGQMSFHNHLYKSV